MSKLKSVNIKAIKHNLGHALKVAVFKDDMHGVRTAAQAIFESGYEIEDMGYTPSLFAVICHTIVLSGWAPKLTDEMIKNIELRDEQEGGE